MRFYVYILLALHSRAYGIVQSHFAPTALHPLQLLATSSEFPDGAYASTTRHPFAPAVRLFRISRRAEREPAGSNGARKPHDHL